MAYTRGSSNDIIVGAAALFTYEAGALADADLPAYVSGTSYKETLAAPANSDEFRNVGYTMNGLEIQFQPDFGEVAVDQVLDVAKLFKQGMQVNLNTTFAESTLENLLFALAGKDSSMTTVSGNPTLNLSAGDIGVAYRALSIESVSVSAKRDEATMFEVSFRLLPNDNASYGKIVDRTVGVAS
jgi:hypothetical protein